MNILIIPSWYSNKDNPVLGSFFREQAVALSKRGHSITLAFVSLHPRNEFISKEHFRIKNYNDNGINVYTYSMPSFGVERNKKLFFEVYYSRYKKLINTILKDGHKIDLIHAHSFYPAGYTAIRLKEHFKIPLIVTEHLSAIPSGTLSVDKINYLKKTVTAADRFICVSESLADKIKVLMDQEVSITVIPNVLSPLFKYDPFKTSVKRDDEFKFVSVGGLINRKRYELLIRTFAEVFVDMDFVKLDVIGEGEQRNTLESLIKSNKLQNRVRLLGRLSREETAIKLSSSDAFVMVSSFETFGVVYIEAMASGLPVIATRNGGAEYIVSENSGIIIDVDDIKQLKEALIYMYKNSNQYNRGEISKKCIDKYSEEVISDCLTKSYIEVI